MTPNVNVPTDLKVKEKDVNAKLQLYGIYSGKSTIADARPISSPDPEIALTSTDIFPSIRQRQGPIRKPALAPMLALLTRCADIQQNKQIDVAMNSALAWKQLTTPSKKLSSEGQQLVGDLRQVIELAKVLLLTKNQGNLLQDFIWQTQQITGGDAKTPNAPIDKDTAKQHGQQTLEGLRTLGTLVLSNGQFRKLRKLWRPAVMLAFADRTSERCHRSHSRHRRRCCTEGRKQGQP